MIEMVESILDMKKTTVLAISGAVILSVAGIGLTQINKTGATTEPPIVQEVKHQGEVLDNHEARITNTENNVKDIQTKTSTPPSQSNTTPPSVVTPSIVPTILPVQEPAPTPITVVAFEVQPILGTENSNCKLTYSDQTTYTWLWQVVEYNQGTRTGRTSGYCNNSVVGTTYKPY